MYPYAIVDYIDNNVVDFKEEDWKNIFERMNVSYTTVPRIKVSSQNLSKILLILLKETNVSLATFPVSQWTYEKTTAIVLKKQLEKKKLVNEGYIVMKFNDFQSILQQFEHWRKSLFNEKIELKMKIKKQPDYKWEARLQLILDILYYAQQLYTALEDSQWIL